eukprot:TRINITY_DN33602_c0_g1_i1.p1 TRINITY_DN33602_c0_g1~~TRINITY_DN33602_c0_g1_i1.p1  ORF type:complete len:915 (-),score=109.28 TRINITY_DN33602_c0_g1_i1:19-2763(-)
MLHGTFISIVTLCFTVFADAHPGTWEGLTIMNEDGAPLPDLSGEWAEDSMTDHWILQFYQPPTEVASPPNSSYALRLQGDDLGDIPAAICGVIPVYDYETRQRLKTTVICRGIDSGSDHVWNNLPSRGHVVSQDVLAWSDGRQWLRSTPRINGGGGGRLHARYSGQSLVHTVHVVFMNHYDVGYTDFINGVDNTYMHKYYELAASTAQHMRANHSAFTYTTHPWLMERYLTCPCPAAPCLATSLNNSFEEPLVCPNRSEIESFSAAARRGDIVWNGVPFNIQPETMSTELLQAGFDMVRRMDQRFDRQLTRTMSIRDAMYVTRAVLPHLRRNGITGLTIGSNGADVPPKVPKLHRWLDPESGADVVVAYHPYGYGGYGLKDCAESPNGVALCTEFRTDNTGPPTSEAEVQDILNKVRAEYPGARVMSSTFDAFMASVIPIKDQLPTVELEVADTWTYGTPSDPLKMAQNKAIQRAWIRCMQRKLEPRCAPSDPAIQNMTFFLLKAPEHTWGTPGISGWGQGGDYDVLRFRKNLTSEGYARAAASWAEQRVFNELAVRALEETNHPLAAEVRRELAVIEHVQAPDLVGFDDVPLDSVVTMESGLRIGFGTDGSITTLVDSEGGEWASPSSPMAGFVYQTFNDSEWKPFTYSYLNDHQMQAGFCKPGSNNYSESALWKPTLTRLLVVGGVTTAKRIVAVMQMPVKTRVTYGAPQTVYLTVSSEDPSSLALSFTTLGKLPTMIGESTSVTFLPAPDLVPVTASSGGNRGSAWRLGKLGGWVDPEGVQDGGNQFTHGVWEGAVVTTSAGVMHIESVDAIIMNPISDDFPVGNPLPASYKDADAHAGTGMARRRPGSVRGMAVNLHNNLWNTNYPLYYPYYDARYCVAPLVCSNSNALARFRLSFSRSRESDNPEVMYV